MHLWRAGFGNGRENHLMNRFALAFLAVLSSTTPCWSAEGAGHSEAIFLAQIVVLVLTGRLLGEAMVRLGQPAVMGQLLAGILLGPSVFGAVWPAAQQALFPSGPI